MSLIKSKEFAPVSKNEESYLPFLIATVKMKAIGRDNAKSYNSLSEELKKYSSIEPIRVRAMILKAVKKKKLINLIEERGSIWIEYDKAVLERYQGAYRIRSKRILSLSENIDLTIDPVDLETSFNNRKDVFG